MKQIQPQLRQIEIWFPTAQEVPVEVYLFASRMRVPFICDTGVSPVWGASEARIIQDSAQLTRAGRPCHGLAGGGLPS
jgi:hypothetical protein